MAAHDLPGTRVELAIDFDNDQTSCGDYPKGTKGTLVDDFGAIIFHPDGYPEGWGFYLGAMTTCVPRIKRVRAPWVNRGKGDSKCQTRAFTNKL